eukprot:scaffold2576_cov418-Prasinococcus_capsulatus_cf.AAC.7
MPSIPGSACRNGVLKPLRALSLRSSRLAGRVRPHLPPPSGATRRVAAAMRVVTDRHQYQCGEVSLSAFVAWDEDVATPSSPVPGVLVAHTAIGPQDAFIESKVRASCKVLETPPFYADTPRLTRWWR